MKITLLFKFRTKIVEILNFVLFFVPLRSNFVNILLLAYNHFR